MATLIYLVFQFSIFHAEDNCIVVLFAEAALDGELVDLVGWVGDGYFSGLEDGDDGGVMLQHGEGSLFAGDGHRGGFAFVEAGGGGDDFEGHGFGS